MRRFQLCLVPMLLQVQVPVVQKVQKTVEVPQIQYEDQVVQVPVQKQAGALLIACCQSDNEAQQPKWLPKLHPLRFFVHSQ